MSIEFVIERSYSIGYGKESSFNRNINRDKFYRLVGDIFEGRHYVVSSRIINRYLSAPIDFIRRWKCCASIHDFNDHIMVLGCDGTDEMLGAVAMLIKDNIGYATIQSSPSHYWIITDYIAKFKSVIAKMRSIPGVDLNYIQFAEQHATLYLRAIALPNRVPIFPDTSKLTNPRSIVFYELFRDHFQHPEIDRRLYAEMVFHNITEKKMIEMAANPDFVL